MSIVEIQTELERLSNAADASFLQRFFKTGRGEYGEGDRFRGIRVPVLRTLVRNHRDVSLADAARLLKSFYHEDRLLSLLLLVDRFKRADPADQSRIFELYLKNIRYINNWDLVDVSAAQIVGAYLGNRNRAPIHRLAKSTNLWERRIAIISTFHYIRKKDFEDTLKVATTLLRDEEDLIHKAVGWMLREVGNRSPESEGRFLRRNYKQMPRTMLRYAIEKFPEPERQSYLRGTA